MSNIFEIQENLISIFNQIEENYGEITPDLESNLAIAESEFKVKVKDYSDYIKTLDYDVAAIDIEIARLKDLKDRKNKLIDKLKSIVSQAIINFGSESKTGTKFVDWGTGKVSIRKTTSVEVNNDDLKAYCKNVVKEFINLRYTNQFDCVTLDTNFIRESGKQQGSDHDIDYTSDDLQFINLDINLKENILDLVNTPKGRNLLRALLEYDVFEMNPTVSKTDIKKADIMPAFAKIVEKNNVTIK